MSVLQHRCREGCCGSGQKVGGSLKPPVLVVVWPPACQSSGLARAVCTSSSVCHLGPQSREGLSLHQFSPEHLPLGPVQPVPPARSHSHLPQSPFKSTNLIVFLPSFFLPPQNFPRCLLPSK